MKNITGKIKWLFFSWLISFLMFFSAALYAQEFGFGFDDDEGSEETAAAPKRAFPVKASGEIGVDLIPYVHDFNKENGAQAISWKDTLHGKLKLSAAAGNVDAYTAFNLTIPAFIELWDRSPNLSDPTYTPQIMDEAYLRGFIGLVAIEAGLRKLSWGKADSMGLLDVTNPLDYSDLRKISDPQAIKIARPMLHVTWNAGGFSKLEGVFIPNFAGHRYAREGRWASPQLTDKSAAVEAEFAAAAEKRIAAMGLDAMLTNPIYASMFAGVLNNVKSEMANSLGNGPSTGGLNYFQTGLRFTTTVGPADIGAQYYYGNLFMPDFAVTGIDTYIDSFLDDFIAQVMGGNFDYRGDTSLLSSLIKYNRYHQIGLDYAQVLFGFNVRSEFAVHLTDDLNGDDGSVRNPFLGWSLGFDRDLFWGINANIQCNETIRLLNRKVGSNPVEDCEADTPVTSTRFTFHFSKKFLRDELESAATFIWDIEKKDCFIIPALIWTVRDLTVELSSGIFAGDEKGDLGQYWENSFVKVGVKYSF